MTEKRADSNGLSFVRLVSTTRPQSTHRELSRISLVGLQVRDQREELLVLRGDHGVLRSRAAESLRPEAGLWKSEAHLVIDFVGSDVKRCVPHKRRRDGVGHLKVQAAATKFFALRV